MNNIRARVFRRIYNLRPLTLSRTTKSTSWSHTLHTRNASSTTATRLSRLESRLPSSLRRYLTPLKSAPLSHISAFLLLHELTAVVPLFGLAALFHYTNWLPPWLADGVWVQDSVKKFGRYALKKGWISGAEEQEAEEQAGRLEEGKAAGGGLGEDGRRTFGEEVRGGQGMRIVVELGTAWAILKALMPVRLAACVWATPWFARVVCLPVWHVVRGVIGRGGVASSGVAGSAPVKGTGVPLPKSLGGGK